ncbi:MAG: glutamate-5-semialdehyde dehydrogenase [Ruminococcus sp.]|nr:glutamate-5-semialdehyde dehydrogenase [Ruminococcus sp.]
MTQLEIMGAKAKEAARFLMTAGAKKDDALLAIARALRDNSKEIIEANNIDIENGKAAGLTDSLLDRLRLDEGRINGMADGVEQVAALSDPVGRVLEGRTLKNGLKIEKVTVPMGVIGIIYEARPNVTSDAAALCLKAGSAVILRGGKEAINSNTAVAKVMRDALSEAGFPQDCVSLITDTSRQSATELMQLTEYLDVLIPRGGAGLIKSVVENAKVPVIETGVGNCHVYVDKSADIDMAANIIFNAKTSRPSVCNAIETVLVHADIADEALPKIKAELDKKNVEIRGCERTAQILGDCVVPATENDYAIEFLDYILAVKVVDSLEDALDHLAKYSTGHSECIVTGDYESANIFTSSVDSAAVYVNSSTRFTDGGEFGLGAEIGISTQKLHARGPMGLNELTSSKFIIRGNGQIRQ